MESRGESDGAQEHRTSNSSKTISVSSAPAGRRVRVIHQRSQTLQPLPSLHGPAAPASGTATAETTVPSIAVALNRTPPGWVPSRTVSNGDGRATSTGPAGLDCSSASSSTATAVASMTMVCSTVVCGQDQRLWASSNTTSEAAAAPATATAAAGEAAGVKQRHQRRRHRGEHNGRLSL